MIKGLIYIFSLDRESGIRLAGSLVNWLYQYGFADMYLPVKVSSLLFIVLSVKYFCAQYQGGLKLPVALDDNFGLVQTR